MVLQFTLSEKDRFGETPKPTRKTRALPNPPKRDGEGRFEGSGS
jgi:hypothetical protein